MASHLNQDGKARYSEAVARKVEVTTTVLKPTDPTLKDVSKM
jgi:hypothetical protein